MLVDAERLLVDYGRVLVEARRSSAGKHSLGITNFRYNYRVANKCTSGEEKVTFRVFLPVYTH